MAKTTLANRHILVIRLSAMGDVAMTVPVLAALRKAEPTVRITVLTRSFFRPFFRSIPDIEFFTPDFDKRHKGVIGLIRLFNDLRRLQIDCVADLHDVLRSKVLRTLFALMGCETAHIDKGRTEKKTMTRKFRKQLVPLKTTVERYRDVFLELGYRFELPASMPKAEHPIPEQILTLAGPKTGIWVGVAPFAKHKGKIYPAIKTGELIGLLSSRYERVFVFGGGKYEQQFGEYMQECYPNIVSVIGHVTLDEELDLMSNIDCMVGMDSATMHLCSLVGTPVVSIWGATHPYAGFYGFGQSPAHAVQLDLPCRPCSVFGNKPCLTHDYRCLEGIAPETIAERVAQVIAAQQKP